MLPKRLKKTKNMRRFPEVNVLSLNNLRSTTGFFEKSSMTTKRISANTVMIVNVTITGEENQSAVCPLSMTNCREPSPTASSISPQ
ncbi:hypothetical protein BMS3Bbin07_01371 [bacterium BMS3Bbin07]|nr:hypothetical protein BMS3Bbin07_01371 [bacterium BMS3Bbin07]